MVAESDFKHSIWYDAANYTKPPISASMAIVPVYYGFLLKSAQQIGKPMPKLRVRDLFKYSLKASPTIGSIIGIQMVAQSFVEKALQSREVQSGGAFRQAAVSALIVGVISTPPLAVFNGQTMGKSVIQSLKGISFKQTFAILARETSFLFSLRISDPLSSFLKREYGQNRFIEYGTAFLSGAIGSIIGHPGDTALTLWQQGMEVRSVTQLWKGVGVKAVATGGFALGYKFFMEFMNYRDLN